MSALKRRVLLRRGVEGVFVTGAGALAAPVVASSLRHGDYERVQQLEAQIAAHKVEIEDLKDDLLAIPELHERKLARADELRKELAEAHEKNQRKHYELKQYVRERDEARTLAVKLQRGESVTLPEWAAHPYYTGGVTSH